MSNKQNTACEHTYDDFEALYNSLKKHDSKNILQLNDEKTIMLIQLNDHYHINIYTGDFETYVEYAKDGKQMTHSHLDYEETFEELLDCLNNPQTCIDFFTENQKKEKQNKKSYLLVVIAICILLIIVTTLYYN